MISVPVVLAHSMSARLRASGGLGAPDRTLVVDIEAPALEELSLPLAGALSAHATLNGDWRAPAIEARVQGNKLAYGPHTIETARATLTYAGGSDGNFSARADVNGLVWRSV